MPGFWSETMQVRQWNNTVKVLKWEESLNSTCTNNNFQNRRQNESWGEKNV